MKIGVYYGGQKHAKTKASFAKGLWHIISCRLWPVPALGQKRPFLACQFCHGFFDRTVRKHDAL